MNIIHRLFTKRTFREGYLSMMNIMAGFGIKSLQASGWLVRLWRIQDYLSYYFQPKGCTPKRAVQSLFGHFGVQASACFPIFLKKHAKAVNSNKMLARRSLSFTLIELLACRGVARRAKRSSNFTLIELLVSMAVFTILMLALIGFFNSAQKVWLNSSRKNEVFEDARIGMDIITNDLQSAFYNNSQTSQGIYPFWHEDDDKINFIASTPLKPTDAKSNICEIRYKRGTTGAEAGWLLRCVTGDNSVDSSDSNDIDDIDNKYNLALIPNDDNSLFDVAFNHPTAGGGVGGYTLVKAQNDIDDNRAQIIWGKQADLPGASTGVVAAGFVSSVDSNPADGEPDFERVIPYVVELKFICLNKEGDDMVTKGTPDYTLPAPNITPFPYSLRMELTLLDRASWEKWKAMGGDVADPSNDTGQVLEFRENNQRKFTKTVYLGDKHT